MSCYKLSKACYLAVIGMYVCRTERALFIEAFISLTYCNWIHLPGPTPCLSEGCSVFVQILCLLAIAWWFVKSRN